MPSASRKEPVACRASSASASGAISICSCAGDALQHGRELLDGRPAEVEAVAAVDDGRQHLLRLGRREHEDRFRRRLLERLEERVPRLRGEHVRLVEDVDLRAAGDRRERDLVAQLADVVDRVVRRGVHLDHVERRRALDRHARLADPARLDRRARSRSSCRRRGSSPSTSCRCRASRRTGRRGAPCPARSRCSACGRRAPARRRPRTCGGGGDGRARGRRTRRPRVHVRAARARTRADRVRAMDQALLREPAGLAADPVDLDRRRRPGRPRARPPNGSAQRVRAAGGEAEPRARSATAIRWPSASCAPPTRTRPRCSSTATTTCRASATPDAWAVAAVRADAARRAHLRARRLRRQGQLPAAAARGLLAGRRRRAAGPRARARRGRGGGRRRERRASGCAPTSAAPTARSSSTPAWRTCTRPRSRSGCAASSPRTLDGHRAAARPALRHVRRRDAERRPRAARRSSAPCCPGPTGVLRDELREGIAPPSPAELESWAAPAPGARGAREVGARPVVPGAGDDWRARTGADASLDVNMLETGGRADDRAGAGARVPDAAPRAAARTPSGCATCSTGCCAPRCRRAPSST